MAAAGRNESVDRGPTPSPALIRRLRRDVRKALRAQGFELRKGLIVPPNVADKAGVRSLHASAVAHRRKRAEPALRRVESRLLTHLAASRDLDLDAMSPELVRVTPRSENELLFRWAALHWSIPVSSGYGRRLRFLIFDQSNGKLIGLIGLGDPVFALSARDNWVGWDIPTRAQNLHHVVDAFVLGAVPPYSELLAGKLIAMLASSNEVRAAWQTQYGGRTSRISEERRDGRLALLTTTSALGRSSLYNRLRFGPDDLLFQRVGETRGSGEFHFSDGLHRVITDFALEFCSPTAKDARWGTGFRNRREVVKKALPALGFSDRLLYHGVRREIFVCPLASNARAFLTGADRTLKPSDLPAAHIVDWYKWRWLHPRSRRLTPSKWSPETWRLYS
jgi:hypothetical protein